LREQRLPTFEWADEGPDVASAPDAVATVVEEWRDARGVVAVSIYTAGDRSWIQLPGVAKFAFDAARDKVTAFPDIGTTNNEVMAAYGRAALPIIQQTRGHQVLHASGVRAASGVVAFCGTSGAGKSTLAYAFAHHGFPVWGDDAVCFKVTEQELVAIGLPFDLLIRPSTATHFSLSPGTPRHQPDEELTTAGLSAVCVLQERATSAGSAEVTPLVGADAFAAMLEHAYVMGLDDHDRRRCLIEEYLQLVTTTPVFALRFPHDLGQLDSVVDTIVRRLELEPPPG
jgi:hypothetical protein